jgi:hypothetical protein
MRILFLTLFSNNLHSFSSTHWCDSLLAALVRLPLIRGRPSLFFPLNKGETTTLLPNHTNKGEEHRTVPDNVYVPV